MNSIDALWVSIGFFLGTLSTLAGYWTGHIISMRLLKKAIEMGND